MLQQRQGGNIRPVQILEDQERRPPAGRAGDEINDRVEQIPPRLIPAGRCNRTPLPPFAGMSRSPRDAGEGRAAARPSPVSLRFPTSRAKGGCNAKGRKSRLSSRQGRPSPAMTGAGMTGVVARVSQQNFATLNARSALGALHDPAHGGP